MQKTEYEYNYELKQLDLENKGYTVLIDENAEIIGYKKEGSTNFDNGVLICDITDVKKIGRWYLSKPV